MLRGLNICIHSRSVTQMAARQKLINQLMSWSYCACPIHALCQTQYRGWALPAGWAGLALLVSTTVGPLTALYPSTKAREDRREDRRRYAGFPLGPAEGAGAGDLVVVWTYARSNLGLDKRLAVV